MRYLPFLYSDLYWGVQLRGHHHPLEALAPFLFRGWPSSMFVCQYVKERFWIGWC